MSVTNFVKVVTEYLREFARAVRAENTILGNCSYPYVGWVNDTHGHEASWKD